MGMARKAISLEQGAPWLDARLFLRIAAMLSTGEEAGVFYKTGQIEGGGFKTSKDLWLRQVADEWDLYMFQKAGDWKDAVLPMEVAEKLSDPGGRDAGHGRRWVSLMGDGALSFS